MKIIVVEDEKKWNERILKVINQVLIERNLDIEIIPFYDYTKELENIIKRKETNVYLLDVEIPKKSGFDIARMIRNEVGDWDSIIIISSVHNLKETFITARLSIFTYLSKFHEFDENLQSTINLILDIFIKNKFITVNDEQIFRDDILYIQKEKDSKYCLIKTFDKEIRIRKSLSELEKKFNLKKIKKYLLINEKNTISLNDIEIVFKNNIKIKIE